MNENELQDKLATLIMNAIDNGYTHFICGGAIGFDMLAAEQILFYKDLMKGVDVEITLEIAVPFPEQDKLYSEVDKSRYAFALKNADKTTLVCNSYNRYCYQFRNKYMVNNSTLIISYFDGSASGTKNTIDYAKKQNKVIWRV